MSDEHGPSETDAGARQGRSPAFTIVVSICLRGHVGRLDNQHLPRFRSYLASAAPLASAFRKALRISSSARPTRIRAHAVLNLALQS
jgi:hypothetical protein